MGCGDGERVDSGSSPTYQNLMASRRHMPQILSRKEFLSLAAGGVAGTAIVANARAADTTPPLASELFFAAPIPNGYTWTLASRMGDMLSLAEELLGPRDTTYTVLGVEIGPDIPRLWFPGNRKHVIVQLSPSAATDPARACYQLAHETVHLLAPNGGGPATNFEEAVACYFAEFYMKKKFAQNKWEPGEPSYNRGLRIISSRLDEDIGCVKRLRSKQLSFGAIQREQLSAEFPGLLAQDLDFLLATFDRSGEGG